MLYYYIQQTKVSESSLWIPTLTLSWFGQMNACTGPWGTRLACLSGPLPLSWLPLTSGFTSHIWSSVKLFLATLPCYLGSLPETLPCASLCPTYMSQDLRPSEQETRVL